MDVCPFIPVQGVTMEDCVECAKDLGERLSAELGVPGKYGPFNPSNAEVTFVQCTRMQRFLKII